MFLFLLLFGLNAWGQKPIKKANKQFELKAFDLAITSYKAVLVGDPNNEEAQLKLADCYRLTGKYIEAIRGYENVIKDKGQLSGEYNLAYAHALKRVGLYDKAQQVYWKNKSFEPIISEHFALGCDFAKNLLSENDRYEISLFRFNSKKSDFGLSFFKNRAVVASFRNEKLEPQKGTTTGNQIFIENEKGDEVAPMLTFSKESRNIGPMSYSKDGKFVAYTVNDFRNGQAQIYDKAKELSISYSLTTDSGAVKDEQAFPYNSNDYSNAFPNLSFNGKAMYFASNMSGGFGGFDLYVSYFKDGMWSKPENLGPSINTIGNEITPFFDGLNLFYASDYAHGLGGFDIFSSKVVDGRWSFGENMGNGVNSPADDYYFVKNYETGEMFFTSNRLGGRGNDDIYVATEYEVIEYVYEKEEENVFVPKAMSLDDLSPIKNPNKNTTPSKDVIVVNLPKESSSDSKVTPVNENTKIKLIEDIDPENVSYAGESADINLFGARKISLGEVYKMNSEVYFIQLAALSSSQGNIDKFRSLVQYGNLYKVYKSNFTKIKLGYYLDRNEAADVLNSVKSIGFGDAFITFETMNASTMELVASSFEQNDYKDNTFDYRNQSKYKVRLGSYSDPLWFDTTQVKDLGKIEQWSKGNWTIFVLSGFNTLDNAQSAMIQAINRGYRDAEIVIDNNGILERLKQN